MKIRHLVSINSVCCGLLLISFSRASHAANLITTNVLGSGATAGWNTANTWKTNLADTVFGGGTPVIVNTYATTNNGIAIANGGNSTTLRNPFVVGQAATQTFPGISLTVHTNSQIRFKQTGTPTVVPVCNFPGVGGNPGLILNGGMLNGGDDTTYPITGKIRVDSQSYICGGNNSGGGPTTGGRAFNVSADISGSGNLMFVNSGTGRVNFFSGTNDTYTGAWIIKCASVQFNGGRSFGTNSSIILDPNYAHPAEWNANFVNTAGPAIFEANYNVNSAGTLTINNGGQFRLHNNFAFTALVIDGTPLSAGTHYWFDLNRDYPNNFPAGGEGAITVQPYGNLPALLPSITRQPSSQAVFAGGSAHFTVTALANLSPPLTYRWRNGGSPISDGGNISGTTNATLLITGVSALDVAGYDVVVSNANGSVTSASAALTIVPTSGEAYQAAVLAAGPHAFYELNEAGDPSTNNSPVYDNAGGYNGTYGTSVQNGNPAFNIAGPTAAAGYPGFLGGNKAAQTAITIATARMAVEAPNLNTNTVTITAWINPNGPQVAFSTIYFCRGGGTVAGLNYAGYTDASGNATLGYQWNDQIEARNWNSGLAAPPGQWSFVALVITPSNATIHVMNTNGLLSASQNFTHVVQSFSGTTLIGDDSAGANGARVFNGVIDDVAVFRRALSKSELVTLFTTASGVTAYAPIIATQPAGQSLYAGQTATFTVVGGGTEPLTYSWKSGPSGGPYAPLTDGGRISGATTPTLNIANLVAGDAMDYLVTLSNSSGSSNSAAATLTVLPTGSAENITMAYLQQGGENWDVRSPTNDWSDLQAASVSAAAKPGSTYELLAGARLRTPEGPTVTNFPGDLLKLDGNAVWNVNPAAGAAISEIRFKQATYGTVNGRVNFKRLVMNGGQLDVGNDNVLLLGGRIDILTNAPFNNDGGNDRGYFVDAWLTGAGSIEYHGYTGASFQSGYRNNLNIVGTSNTFSGSWNIVQGVLLGSAPGSLGTNSIVIGALGALETLYDIGNSNGNLVLNGKMFLHQNDVFRTVTVSGISLNQGTYTFAQLAAAYPANFPSNWTQQTGSTISNASGSITVLVQAGPLITSQPQPLTLYGQQTAQFFVTAVGNPPLGYQWRAAPVGSGSYTNLSDGGRIAGSTTTNLSITNITAANGLDYVVVVTNALGGTTSSVARLTVRPEPLITLQPLSQDAYQGETVAFNTYTLGLLPQTYTWQLAASGSGGPYTTLTDGGRISGATTTNLTITALDLSDAADYIFIASNAGGSVTSSVAALTITPTNPPENITWSAVVGTGAANNWNNGAFWSDGLSASVSSRLKPHSTYEVLTGARFRPPEAVSFAAFPGEVLTIDGIGVWNEAFYTGNGNDATVAEIRFKHNNPGTNHYPRLVMAGGILDNGDNGIIYLTGQMDIVSNTIFYATSDSGQERGYTVSSWLTGNGGIEYHAWGNDYSGNLNIAGNTNTYSGPWHVFRGALLGSGLNSLGGGNITMDAGTALETLYNVTNGGDLVLNGKMFLHQNDTFHSVTVNGTALYGGTYTFAQLNAAYPANFPAIWTPLVGSSASSGSGSLTVLTPPAPTVGIQKTNSSIVLTWSQGLLLEADEVTGPWVTNTSATSPFTVTPTGPRKFYRLQLQ